MSTELLKVDAEHPDPGAIARAATAVRRGELVAFPTETVYGLGADALNAAAVTRIYEAKGRPERNPLIVHVPDAAAAQELAEWTPLADALATRFWPGPLTLVLPKRDLVPDVVTAGGSTVALRAPAHPVAQALLRAAGTPIAAPSANRSSGISATRAEHVLCALDGRIELILDGGPTPGGIESTVLSLVETQPRLLRPGLLSAEDIEVIVGPLARANTSGESTAALPSPGMLSRHYAPKATLELAPDDGYARTMELVRSRHRVGWLRFAPTEGTSKPFAIDRLRAFVMPRDAAGYAALLYDTLHALDAWGADHIVVEPPPNDDAWLAIRDRLTRAATLKTEH
ncbi:MAG: L-threonylcarbamoyladenylate synthase [Planctomycetia bacterium]|nr:L-threonylcarbamoyladenylate synthase [Planctomycetia bacterium]